ncbi:MAG: indolepyruvate ferredoxin oxidoreductase [Bacteriovoracaceae bacterium]|nr:indolepyruvate ferredoxin oxidoreductase [Bacteriovoracaceae bacterium]
MQNNSAVKTRILFAGTGGQGVLTAASILTETLVEMGLDVVSSQLHGMAQRGGSVQAAVLVNCGLSSALKNGDADVVLGLEPAETARALNSMSSKSVVFMNSTPILPFVLGQEYIHKKGDGKYPEVSDLIKDVKSKTSKVSVIDATELAEKAGEKKALNMVFLGCLLGSGLLPCNMDEFWGIISEKMPPKFKEINTKAFISGVEIGKQQVVG